MREVAFVPTTTDGGITYRVQRITTTGGLQYLPGPGATITAREAWDIAEREARREGGETAHYTALPNWVRYPAPAGACWVATLPEDSG